MRMQWWVLAGTLALVACTPSEPAPEAPASPGSQAPSAVASTAGSVAPSALAEDLSDPGPKLSRKTGATPAKDLPAVATRADAWQRKGDAVFVEVAMPDDISKLPTGALQSARVLVQGDRYGLAVPAGEGRVADRPLALVRFVGTTPPKDFTLQWSQPSTIRQPGMRLDITVQIGEATTRDTIEERFFEAAAKWFGRRGAVGFRRDELFHAYAGARLERLANLARPAQRRRPRRASRSEVAETMRLYTGLTSVEEALQSDRGLLIPAENYTGEQVPLSSVKPVALVGHPWGDLIDAHPKKVALKIEHLARFAPADAIYLHFHDLRTLVRLAADVDDLIRPLGRVFEERPGDRRLMRRYERQLAVERMGLAKTLGHLAVQSIALVAGDAFLRDGADVAVLFHVRNAALLDKTLATYELRSKARRPDMQAQTLTIAGKSVRRLWTADGEINRFEVDLGDDVRGLANTEVMITRLIAVAGGKAPGLASSGEYRYFRLDAPPDPTQESGFVFIGDALVAKTVSPRTKILQARRMSAQSELYAVNYAALLYGWFHGQPPANAEALVKSGLLAASELKHAGGGAIAFDPKRGASSARWGRPGALKPLSAFALTTVSTHEASAFVRFAESYQRNWTGFIDPIGVRVKRSEDGKRVSLDARMMPLIQSSDYNDIERMVGRTRVLPSAPVSGLRSVLAVGDDARLRRTVDQLGRSATGNRDIGLGWLGDWVMIGASDRSGIWDTALSVGEVPGTEGRADLASPENRKKVIDRIPVYVGAHIKQGLALAATLAALKGLAESAAPGMVTWGPDGAHREIPIVTVAESIGGEGISVHYATAKNVFLLALERAVLIEQIDLVLDGKLSKPAAATDDAGTQASLVLMPKAGKSWLNHTLLGMLERGITNSHHAAALAYEALSVGRGGLPKDPEAQAELGLDWLGQVPVSAHGGDFSMNARGVVEHTIYGSMLAPSRPKLPVEGSRVTAFANALSGLEMSLSFFGEGATRGLRSRVVWTRR
jgi:hypothetical protein